MPDFLTKRNGTWHFARRVPAEFAHLDSRGVIKHSTKIKVADDRAGRQAARVAGEFNKALEAEWAALAKGHQKPAVANYETARRRARSLGFEYRENAEIIAMPADQSLQRLETLVEERLVDDPGATAALLGTIEKPAFMLSELFVEYEAETTHEVLDLSPDQLRIWRNGKIRAVKNFVAVVTDMKVTDLNASHGRQYRNHWRDRVVAGEVAAKSANKDIGQISRMLKTIKIVRDLPIPDIFKGLYLKGEVEKQRMPFEQTFIQDVLLADHKLDGLNEDARYIFYVMADTGLRPSEICNLTEATIKLDAKIPYVRILPEGRRLKTEDSAREVPLVGAALAALKHRPKGFPRYRDKSSGLSATLNKFLDENGLRPTDDHTVYSLRHSFKDRLTAAEAPDSLIDNLMGHKTHKPKYGKGPSLELKLKFLQQIAFKAPASL